MLKIDAVSNNYASSTAIREMLLKKQSVQELMPSSSYNILKKELSNGRFVLNLSQFEKQIIYKLRCMYIEEIANLPDVSEGLEYKIKEAANSCNNLESLQLLIKSKRYTMSRINRILLYALLDITSEDMINAERVMPYIRVLGVSENGKGLLSELNSNKKLNVITSVKQFFNNSNNKILKSMLEKDIFASNIYTMEYKKNPDANLDFTKKLIVV